MLTNPIQIKFQNRRRPKAGFDLIDFSDIYTREGLDHSPFQHHRVTFFILLLITEGEGTHTIDFTDYQLQKGTLLTIRKDQIQQFGRRSTAQGKLLLFTDEFLVSYLEELEALKTMQLFNEVLGASKVQLSAPEMAEILALVERIHQEYFQSHDDYSLGIIRSELHILITKLYRIKARLEQTIDHRKYLEEFIYLQNLVEQSVFQHRKVQFYARKMGVSTKTLNNVTRSILHKSAKTFVDEIATKQIKRLLINTDLSVKEVAYTAGFEESTNFYKYFKRQTGTTPEQFRSLY